MTKLLDDFVRDVRDSGLLPEPDLRAWLGALPLPGRDPLQNNARLFRGNRFDATCFRVVSSGFPRTGRGTWSSMLPYT